MSSVEPEQACRHRRDVPQRRTIGRVASQAVEIVIAIALTTIAGCGGSGARSGGELTSVAPGSSFPAVTPNGAWCWFADPRAITVEGEHRRTYTGWVDNQGAVSVASIDHESGDVRATAFEAFREQDDHASPAIMIRPDRHLLVFYSAHGGDELLYRVSLRPEDVTSWSEPGVVPLDEVPVGYGLTYPNPIVLSGEDDRIFLFYRGHDRRPRFVFTLEGGGWSDEHQLVRTERGDSYAKYASDGEKTIHIAFTYGHPQGRPSNSLYYARYRDGRFERADGSDICSIAELPFEPADADTAYDAVAGGARAWVWDVAADSDGHPAIVYAVFPRPSDHRYRYACWDGDSWIDHEIARAGPWFPDTPPGQEEKEVYYSGGAALDHGNPSVVYLSRSVRGVFEVERWVTPDRGKSWRSEAVTSGSSVGNVRPVVPRHHTPDGPGLLWMSGPYVSYTDYGTSIRMAPAASSPVH